MIKYVHPKALKYCIFVCHLFLTEYVVSLVNYSVTQPYFTQVLQSQTSQAQCSYSLLGLFYFQPLALARYLLWKVRPEYCALQLCSGEKNAGKGHDRKTGQFYRMAFVCFNGFVMLLL